MASLFGAQSSAPPLAPPDDPGASGADASRAFQSHIQRARRSALERERSARVWMAKPFGEVPPVPVRLTINTPLGSVIAHLNAASVESGGKKIKLKRSEPSEKK